MFAFVDRLDWLSALFNHEEINIWDKTNVIPDCQKDGGSAPDGTFELLVGWAMGFGQWETSNNNMLVLVDPFLAGEMQS